MTVKLGQADVTQLAGERAAAEARAHAAPPEGGAGHAPGASAPPIEALTKDAHAETIKFLFAVAQLAGGRAPREGIPPIVAELSYPAAVKYGGRIPYFEELALVGAGLLVYRECFAARPDEDKPTAKTEEKKPT